MLAKAITVTSKAFRWYRGNGAASRGWSCNQNLAARRLHRQSWVVCARGMTIPAESYAQYMYWTGNHLIFSAVEIERRNPVHKKRHISHSTSISGVGFANQPLGASATVTSPVSESAMNAIVKSCTVPNRVCVPDKGNVPNISISNPSSPNCGL